MVVNYTKHHHIHCVIAYHTHDFVSTMHHANHDSSLESYNTLNIKQYNCHFATLQHKCTSKSLLLYTNWILCVLGLHMCELEIEIPKSRVQTIVRHFCLMFECQEFKLLMQNPWFHILAKSP